MFDIVNITKFKGEPEVVSRVMNSIKGFNGDIDFNKIIPLPDDVHTGYISSDDTEQIEGLWGTISNAYHISQLDESTILYYTCQYAPKGVITELAKQNPDIEINHIWDGYSMGYETGEMIAKNGICDIRHADHFQKDAYEIMKRLGRVDNIQLGEDGYMDYIDEDKYLNSIVERTEKGINDFIKPISKE